MSKNSNKISLTIKGMDWFLLIYLISVFFIPQIIEPADIFLKPFMGVYTVVYSIINTLAVVLEIIGLIAIYIMTYTTKLDDSKKEPTVPEHVTLWKFIIGVVKNSAIVYFASNFNLNYIAAITSLGIICSIFFIIVQNDFFTKMTKLKLAYKE